MAFKFTQGQSQAIHESGHDILVSASAGSGKTRVLVERVVDKIKHGIDVDRLLILTFTEAAAKEMKERIQKALREACNQTEDERQKSFLINQLVKLNTADISTIDAFCLKFIRNYYYKASLDPSFRLLTDQTEKRLLREDVLNDLLEKLYGQDDADFIELAENFSNDRSDDGLTELIMRVFDFANVNPDPESWIKSLPQTYQIGTKDFTESAFFKEKLLPMLVEKLRRLAINMEKARVTMQEQDESFFAKQIALFEDEGNRYENYAKMLEDGADYATLQKTFAEMSYARFPSTKRTDDPLLTETKANVKLIRDEAKKIFTEKIVPEYFAVSSTDLEQSLKQAYRLVKKLSEVVLKFAAAYQTEKRSRRVLEFSDLEHYTLSILQKNEDIRQDLEERYAEIMVDEYQDTNQLQETILTTIARKSPGNMFMVGDVKQSIYGFRLADPGLFLEKYRRYATDDSDGQRIILAENFRSVKNVASITNLIFSQIMSREVGEMDYDDNAQLVYGSSDYPEKQPTAEILLYFDKRNETAEKTTGKMRWDVTSEDHESMDADFTIESAAQGQMLATAEKIKQLVDAGFEIYDRRQRKMRKVSYGDIAVLSGTHGNHLILSEEFKRLGIPYKVQKSENYFQTTELRIMLALLNVIDNPRQDIPLVAVLRSPIVGLNENELALLRINDRSGDYYQALLKFYEEAPGQNQELHDKVKKFMEMLERFRTLARQNELATLIWKIYDETHFLEYVSGMPGGSQRAANLHALYERAAAYEKTSFKGLFQFIRFINKMQDQNEDLASALNEASDDVVSVMTIHGSKGLEFPVVFLVDATKRFNTDSLKGKYLLNEKDGVSITCLNRKTRVETVTPMQSYAKEKAARKLCAEQMRLLYVALTRAEQKLFIVAGYKDEDDALSKWKQAKKSEELLLSADVRENAVCFMDWIGAALYRERNFCKRFDCADDVRSCHYLDKFSAEYEFEKISFDELSKNVDNQPLDLRKWLKDQAKEELDADDADFINKVLTYRYEHEGLVKTAAYQSVSEIKSAFADPDEKVMSRLDPSENEEEKANRFVSKMELPKFMVHEEKISGAAIGSAVHLVMEKLDLTKKPSESSVKEKISELVEDGILNEEVAKRIRISDICRFFETNLGKTILEKHEFVKREVPFSLLIPANEIFVGLSESDPVLVHGIIDGYVDDGKKVILFDYKTDHATEENVPEVKKRYDGQIELYSMALKSILNKPVDEKYLYLTQLGKAVDL